MSDENWRLIYELIWLVMLVIICVTVPTRSVMMNKLFGFILYHGSRIVPVIQFIVVVVCLVSLIVWIVENIR